MRVSVIINSVFNKDEFYLKIRMNDHWSGFGEVQHSLKLTYHSDQN